MVTIWPKQAGALMFQPIFSNIWIMGVAMEVLSYCMFDNVSGLMFGVSNSLYKKPFFCDPENGDYGLAANSPALGWRMAPCPLHAKYSGPVWYVSKQGTSSNEGNADSPLATIQDAINSSSNGDTILVNVYLSRKPPHGR